MVLFLSIDLANFVNAHPCSKRLQVLEHVLCANYVVMCTIDLLAICRFLFQQSGQFADMEKQYNFLQREAEKFLDVEDRVNLISEKVIINLSIG